MKKILYVEDDALIARVYSEKLVAAGFELVVANDGLAAIQKLREFTPDLVVLDLLMPKLTGVDVLKFMRGQPALKDTRIIVFSNSFLSNLIDQVARIGVEEALVKAAVTPAQLVGVIHNTLARPAHEFLTTEAILAHMAGASTQSSVAPVVPVAPVPVGRASEPAAPPPPVAPVRAVVPVPPPAAPSAFEARARKDFLDKAPVMLQGMRQLCRDFLDAGESPIEGRKIEDLRRKIGFVAQTLGVVARPQLAQLCGALEAMLFELEDKPATITDSIRHTIVAAVMFVVERFEAGVDEKPNGQTPWNILLVDDDAVSSRAAVLALGRAKLAAMCVNDPFDGLKRLEENLYDLVLLDVNMPGIDGITLCDQMRRLPQHKKTPVIFVTSQADFKTRARTLLSGANDFIAKPILPTELCVKVLAHLVKAG